MNSIINILKSILKFGIKEIFLHHIDQDYLVFNIHFIDWEIQNHKNEKGSTLDNCDYWLPILRNELKIAESNWHDSNHAMIRIERRECLALIRKYKFQRVLKK